MLFRSRLRRRDDLKLVSAGGIRVRGRRRGGGRSDLGPAEGERREGRREEQAGQGEGEARPAQKYRIDLFERSLEEDNCVQGYSVSVLAGASCAGLAYCRIRG